MSDRDVMMAEAILGRDAEEFLASELGRYIIGRCEQEVDAAQDQLARVSPWRRNRIRELQNEVWRARSLKAWLVEMINAGRMAEQAMEDE